MDAGASCSSPPKKKLKADVDTSVSPQFSPASPDAAQEVDFAECEELNAKRDLVLEKVPPEIWDTIFLHLPPEDLLTVLNSCPKYYDILVNKRNSILFPLVLPHLIKELQLSDILTCRLVSKKWKQAIDKPLQDYSTTMDSFEGHWWHSDSSFADLHGILDRRFFMEGTAEVTKFLDKFSQTHEDKKENKNSNPFVSRSATFKFGVGNDFKECLEKVRQVIRTYGKHIWDFTQFCPSIAGVEDTAGISFPSLLRVLPNLRTLKIDWNSHGHEVVRVPHDTLSFLRVSRFPPLKHLKALNFDVRGGGELEIVVGRALLRNYGHQLTTLTCRGDFLAEQHLETELLLDGLPKLENLRIFSVNAQALKKIIEVHSNHGRSWPLKRLQFWYSFRSQQFRTVIRAINTFSDTLTQLHIDIKLDFPFQWSNEHLITPEEMNVTFPNLKKLSAPVSCVNSPWFWEFIKNKFKNLERLDLQTAMESLFAPYQKNFLSREIQQAKRFFTFMPKLKKIWFWFHNDGNLVLCRESCC